jgi:hypothetical protein
MEFSPNVWIFQVTCWIIMLCASAQSLKVIKEVNEGYHTKERRFGKLDLVNCYLTKNLKN